VHHAAFGRILQPSKYSYGARQSFASNSENFQKSVTVEKCEQFLEMLGVGTRQVAHFFVVSQSASY
jgi:hypothetical protein